jgi:hypothetical protein
MDANWTLPPPKVNIIPLLKCLNNWFLDLDNICLQGSLPCLLCKCVISFANKDKTRYFQHLSRDHGAFFNLNLVLIINLLERSQLLSLVSRIKGESEEEDRRREEARDAQVAMFTSVSCYSGSCF